MQCKCTKFQDGASVPYNEPLEVPKELLLCLQDDAEALQFFNFLNESEQHNYVKWIYSAKTEHTKVDRMAKTVLRLSKRQKFTDRQ
ncbi:MAG: YdeI/OmpD-associated family protein [Tannerella sp.]|jgi:uncharacterized protein YdeI (YjbR/CyaY-like superfamily)|nr:YdeI/OmpD-associated family protein [Tannerella sp.]